MEKIIERGLLFDFYGELLTSHQKQVYEALVYNDMTLQEIGDEYGISRQAAHDLIKRCDKQLLNYEEKLHLIAKFNSIKTKVAAIEEITSDTKVKKLVVEILDEI
ncbi:MAG: DNA-binding protein [Lachnospiraceae bacterium]|nr:DNA-binding protein [Candidatus Colinaster equi]